MGMLVHDKGNISPNTQERPLSIPMQGFIELWPWVREPVFWLLEKEGRKGRFCHRLRVSPMAESA